MDTLKAIQEVLFELKKLAKTQSAQIMANRILLVSLANLHPQKTGLVESFSELAAATLNSGNKITSHHQLEEEIQLLLRQINPTP